MDSLGDLFNAAIGGGISGSGVAVLARLWFGSVIERNKKLSVQNDELAKALDELKTKDVADLKKRVDEHVKDDKSQRMLTLLETYGGSLEQIQAQLDGERRETSKWQAQIERQLGSLDSKIDGHALYIGNLDKSLQNHCSAHNSGRKQS